MSNTHNKHNQYNDDAYRTYLGYGSSVSLATSVIVAVVIVIVMLGIASLFGGN